MTALTGTTVAIAASLLSPKNTFRTYKNRSKASISKYKREEHINISTHKSSKLVILFSLLKRNFAHVGYNLNVNRFKEEGI